MKKWFDKKFILIVLLTSILSFFAQSAYGWIGGLLTAFVAVSFLILGFFIGIDQARQWKQDDSRFWHEFLNEKKQR